MKKYDAYKDSGVKWIGEIPNHWEAIKISRVHPIIGSGTTPLSSREDYYSEKGLNWLQTGDLNNGLITETSKKITPKAVDECKRKISANEIEMGKIFICKYLPGHLIPEKFDELEFDEFFKLIAMAEISREMMIRDLEEAVNHGVAAIFPDAE